MLVGAGAADVHRPAGNTRVFSLTLAAPVFRDIAENPTNREKTIYNSTTDTPNIYRLGLLTVETVLQHHQRNY